MIIDLLLPQLSLEPSFNPVSFYCLEKKPHLCFSYGGDLKNYDDWFLVFGDVEKKQSPLPPFKNPIKQGGFTLEKETLAVFLAQLTGVKNLKPELILPFAFTRLSKSILPIKQSPQFLNPEELGQMVHYFLFNRLFSYQMLRALFEVLKPQVDISAFVSQRVYQDFIAETDPFYQEGQKNLAFESLTLFIANYHYHDFLREIKLLPNANDSLFLNQFVEQKNLKNHILSLFFQKEKLYQLVKRQVDPKKLPSFFALISYQTLSQAFDALEWENFKPFVSSRMYQLVLDDIWSFYRKENALSFKHSVLEALVLWAIKESPPFLYLGKMFELKELLNLVFDHAGPFYSAIFFKSYPEFQENLAFLTGTRKQFILSFIQDEIQKKSGISAKEQKTALHRFHFFTAAAFLFPEIWYTFTIPA